MIISQSCSLPPSKSFCGEGLCDATVTPKLEPLAIVQDRDITNGRPQEELLRFHTREPVKMTMGNTHMYLGVEAHHASDVTEVMLGLLLLSYPQYARLLVEATIKHILHR